MGFPLDPREKSDFDCFISGGQTEDFLDNCRKAGEDKVAMDGADPVRFEEKRSATRDARSFGVLPFVADDERVIEVEMPFETCFD